MYKIVAGPVNGSIAYLFKLGDFGIGREYRPGERVTPIPPAPEEPHQAPIISSTDYDQHVDLEGVHYIMSQMFMHYPIAGDKDFLTLNNQLQNGEINAER